MIYIRTLLFYGLLLFVLIQSILAYEKIKLTQINKIELTKRGKTTTRRYSSENQLQCIGGTAGCGLQPSVVTCYYTTTWSCVAYLDIHIGFGSIDVKCEGYDNDEDPYVLVDSCRVFDNKTTYSCHSQVPFLSLHEHSYKRSGMFVTKNKRSSSFMNKNDHCPVNFEIELKYTLDYKNKNKISARAANETYFQLFGSVIVLIFICYVIRMRNG